VVKRYQLLIFFILAFAFSWWGNLSEPHSMFPLGPFIAALIVLPLAAGKSGLVDFLSRIVRWRISWRWYVLAIGLPLASTLIAVGLNILLGALPAVSQLPPMADILGTALFILIVIGLGEEPAWRGFALPRLMIGRSVLSASLIFGLIHIFWHLPLVGLEYNLQNGLPWAVSVMAGSIFTAWMYVRTDGNLLLPLLFHTTVNVTAKYTFGLYRTTDQVQLFWLWGSLWGMVAVTIILVAGPSFRSKTEVAYQGRTIEAVS
jgi:membrane protease YdiL (CAAX protease family)